MKANRKALVLRAVAVILSVLLTAGCSPAQETAEDPQGSGKIYLYGEPHSMESILSKEVDLWSSCYHNDGMRHLFVEYPYYTAAYLNLWMQSDNDDILNALYEDIEGTVAHSPMFLDFYKRIKDECPETVFHGTDVGHQYDTTGKRFLEYLEANGQQETELYRLSRENVEQGRYFYEHLEDPEKQDHAYRENTMTENFIREFESLNGADIMGIYGTGHTVTDAMDVMTQTVPCMGNQLSQKYGDALIVEEVEADPLRIDTMTVDGKEYDASYFGRAHILMQNQTSGEYTDATLEFWRLENAYEDLRSKPLAGKMLSYDNCPMKIEKGQAFFVRSTMEDGSQQEEYYRSDGTFWHDWPVLSGFTLEEP